MTGPEDEISKELQELDSWEITASKVSKSFNFASTKQAKAFASEVQMIAEKQDHYAAVTIVQNTVRISSESSDVEHVTEKDVMLAKAIDELYSRRFAQKVKGDFLADEDEFLREEEGKDKARKRTRGPYRKSSSVGL